MIGSSDSRIEAENTIKTLKSYEMISQIRETPVISIYFENCKETPRGQVDQRIQTTIVLLAAFFSGENRELDSADLINFLNYPKVTSFSPNLANMDFFSKTITVGKDQSVISVVTLTDTDTDSSTGIPVEYQAVGFIGTKTKESINVALPIHAVTISGYFHNVISRLENTVKIIDEARGAFVEKSIVQTIVPTTVEGLIL